jgi:hypothetical protein
MAKKARKSLRDWITTVLLETRRVPAAAGKPGQGKPSAPASGDSEQRSERRGHPAKDGRRREA